MGVLFGHILYWTAAHLHTHFSAEMIFDSWQFDLILLLELNFPFVSVICYNVSMCRRQSYTFYITLPGLYLGNNFRLKHASKTDRLLCLQVMNEE